MEMLPFEAESEGTGTGKLVMNGGSSPSRINIYLILNVHVGWRVCRGRVGDPLTNGKEHS